MNELFARIVPQRKNIIGRHFFALKVGKNTKTEKKMSIKTLM